jgi:hypothetical protein
MLPRFSLVRLFVAVAGCAVITWVLLRHGLFGMSWCCFAVGGYVLLTSGRETAKTGAVVISLAVGCLLVLLAVFFAAAGGAIGPSRSVAVVHLAAILAPLIYFVGSLLLWWRSSRALRELAGIVSMAAGLTAVSAMLVGLANASV